MINNGGQLNIINATVDVKLALAILEKKPLNRPPVFTSEERAKVMKIRFVRKSN